MSFSRKESPPTGFSSGNNLVTGLDRFNLLYRWDQRQMLMDQVRRSLIQSAVTNMDCMEDVVRFEMRITSICWHPKYHYTYAVGSKHGDIVVGSMDRVVNGRTGTVGWKSRETAEIKGSGAGNSITAMQFDPNDANIFYRTSIDGTVSRVDLQHSSNNLNYWDFDNYTEWFTSMDINFNSRTLIAGDNRGTVRLFNLNDGKSLGSHRFHSSKIHDIQFSKRDPNFLVTAGLENARGAAPVKVWDMRMLSSNKRSEPLISLDHNAGVNVARFNPTNGSQLLTSDQDNEIRVYPFLPSLVGDPTPIIIQHRHKQFQHITAIKASWHPLGDLIVIGKYPKKTPDTSCNLRKSIEFFNAQNGAKVGEILQPQDKIVSLNVFNPTGELLASGMSSELLIWHPSGPPLNGDLDNEEDDDEGPPDSNARGSNEPMNLSQAVRDRLRGKNTRTRTGGNAGPRRRAREYSPISDDEENDENGKTKRARKVPSATKKTKTAKKK